MLVQPLKKWLEWSVMKRRGRSRWLHETHEDFVRH
jgi:hypothetical protein